MDTGSRGALLFDRFWRRLVAAVPAGRLAGRDGGRCPVARTLLTYGQSSDPGSPHSSDRTRLHSGEKWVTSRFCEKDILASPKPKVVWARERR
jgi:acyl-homoserine lactone acylase PvdQ